MTLIKNINGISPNKCKCGSLLEHWEKFSRHRATYCAEEKCIDENVIGAYVQESNSSKSDWYIIPLCRLHATSKTELDVIGTLVPANPRETCEKKSLLSILMDSSLSRFITFSNKKVEPQHQFNR